MSSQIFKTAHIDNLRIGIEDSFTELEVLDEIVRYVYVNAATMKKVILEIPEEIKFDYIPNGVGYLRTAYLKFHPGLRDDVIKFTNYEDTLSLKLELLPI